MYDVFEQLLQKKGITAYKVSKDTGITQTLLSNWKNGKSIPNMHNLKKIADYFGVTIDYLMNGKESENNENEFSELSNLYLSYAKEAQESGINPEDIKLAIETINQLRRTK